jgi:DNA-binding MarR family transcriptional regulator
MFLFGKIAPEALEALKEAVSPRVAIAQEHLFHVARAANSIVESLDQAITQHPITQAQFRLLMVLSFQLPEGAPTSEVAETLGIRAPTLSQLVDTSEHLVQRERTQNDRRVMWLSATPEGRALLETVLPSIGELALALSGGLGEEMDSFRALIETGANALTQPKEAT